MKKISLFLVLTLTLCLLAGCGGTPAASETTAAPEATEAPLTTAAPETAVPETEAPGAEDDVHPMLFHVTGEGDRELWLFGTIHVGDSRIEQAQTLVEPYLADCDALAVEFDIVAYEQDTKAQMRDLAQFVYTDGTKVSDHMPSELYERAAALLQEAGLAPGLMANYNVAMWTQLVDQAAIMTRTDFDLSVGMDRSLIQYCYEHNIPVRDVESSSQQYGLLNSFSDELNLLMMEQTLEGLEDYGENLHQLYEAWADGDYDHIVEVLDQEDDLELTPEQEALVEDYNHQMLDQRNLGMAEKAQQWLEAGDKVFFAVGAAHLVGDAGLVELLRQAGYTVEQVQYR